MRTRRLHQRLNYYRKLATKKLGITDTKAEVIVELLAELDASRLALLQKQYDDANASYQMTRLLYESHQNKRSIAAKSIKKTRDVLHAEVVTLGKQIAVIKRTQVVTKRSKRCQQLTP